MRGLKPWSATESESLNRAFESTPPNVADFWGVVARSVPGRTAVECSNKIHGTGSLLSNVTLDVPHGGPAASGSRSKSTGGKAKLGGKGVKRGGTAGKPDRNGSLKNPFEGSYGSSLVSDGGKSKEDQSSAVDGKGSGLDDGGDSMNDDVMDDVMWQSAAAAAISKDRKRIFKMLQKESESTSAVMMRKIAGLTGRSRDMGSAPTSISHGTGSGDRGKKTRNVAEEKREEEMEKGDAGEGEGEGKAGEAMDSELKQLLAVRVMNTRRTNKKPSVAGASQFTAAKQRQEKLAVAYRLVNEETNFEVKKPSALRTTKTTATTATSFSASASSSSSLHLASPSPLPPSSQASTAITTNAEVAASIVVAASGESMEAKEEAKPRSVGKVLNRTEESSKSVVTVLGKQHDKVEPMAVLTKGVDEEVNGGNGIMDHELNVIKSNETKSTQSDFIHKDTGFSPSSTLPYTIPPSTIPPSTIPPSTIPPSTIPPSTIPPSTIQPSTIQPSTIQLSSSAAVASFKAPPKPSPPPPPRKASQIGCPSPMRTR
eukprot:CAMPEP_0175084110 /NCGR_PEP_ID=MMETSP0052_2-20121109/27839_1 /TAXON_ID=51329 ORGANISM="Polytomella parva, Strain SAG 63-3" /NCGR_SAMPLE_ID=MMETSP0052_2 /ASSEMBLY_ACC=CAM_ASM_000194 /LENGTH=541 /DNA_ID=CAMNT_0016355801 /DNA_START=148 /DNA_END=1770 /DNA_ORIENTATION=+